MTAIVCLTRVWQSLLPLFCDKTFEFAIQTWQASFEHYYVYVQTYLLSQLRKMLILLISSYCKMCILPTLQSRVFVCCEQYKHGTYRKVSEISAALGNSATIIKSQNNYWGNSATPNPSKDTFHQMSATQ